MIHVFIVASKGIPAKYGGFETFVENLTARRSNKEIQYHVSCMNNEEKHFIYNDADCFNVKVPLPGAPGRIFHVSCVLRQVADWAKAHPGEKTIVYILGCRIGPLLGDHARKLHKLGVRVWCNPDGLEWKRTKWNAAVQKFLRWSEKCLVEESDFIICDSVTIRNYIMEKYPRKRDATEYIAYGAELVRSECSEEKLQRWYDKYGISKEGYYLVVGRFVPENNFETIIREFMRSTAKRDLVLITDAGRGKFYNVLTASIGFESDQRIKFVGTVYDSELLTAIRKNAHGYLHGHSVGGTNPSLLEALAITRLNLLFDVAFNREVALDSALYWSADEGNMSSLIERAEAMDQEELARMGAAAKKRIDEQYQWRSIIERYETAFMDALK